MLSNAISDHAATLVRDGSELSFEELMSIVHDAGLSSAEGIEADVFTYKGRTLVLAYAAPPLRDRFSARMRYKRNAVKA